MSLTDFTPYLPALLSLSVLILTVLIQSVLTAPLAFVRREQSPGMPVQGDHRQLSFRVLRTYQNSIENLPAFALALIVAILLGLSSRWINTLAIIHLLCRLAFWAVYYAGIGRPAGGPRTLCYVGGLLTNLLLVGLIMFELAAILIST